MLSQTTFPFPPLISFIDNQPSEASETKKLAALMPLSGPSSLPVNPAAALLGKSDQRRESTSGTATLPQNTQQQLSPANPRWAGRLPHHQLRIDYDPLRGIHPSTGPDLLQYRLSRQNSHRPQRLPHRRQRRILKCR
jgi:hypothetical protein